MKSLLKNYSRIWFFLLLGTVGVAVLLTINQNLKVPNILNVEFSESLRIFNGLVNGQESNLRANTWFDFLFILAYSLLFLASLKVASLSLQTRFKKRYYLICLLPALFDIIENVSLIIILDQGKASAFDWFYSAVRVKWALVIPFILMVLTIILFYALLLLGKILSLFIGKSRVPQPSNKN